MMASSRIQNAPFVLFGTCSLDEHRVLDINWKIQKPKINDFNFTPFHKPVDIWTQQLTG